MSTERRKFTGDYKMEAIRLVTNKGMSFGEVGKKLGIRETMLSPDYAWPLQNPIWFPFPANLCP